ncbi:MAG: hypothetical protein KDD32_02000 [Bacteroidetes bacterium]|nr:hypothetical protein [Bacteroidota bacterium]
MKPYLFFTFLVFIQYTIAQVEPIELLEEAQADKVVLVAKNSSDKDLVIHVKVDLENAQANVNTPIKRVIEAGNKEVLGELSAIDAFENWTYKTSYTYERYIPPVNLMAAKDSIVVFTMTGCGRCDYTLDYLKHHEFAFTEYNTTRNFENNMLMWNTLRTTDETIRDVRMPVIIVNGEIAFNIKSLPAFMEALEPTKDKEPMTPTTTSP